jgi:hypothetical protein
MAKVRWLGNEIPPDRAKPGPDKADVRLTADNLSGADLDRRPSR